MLSRERLLLGVDGGGAKTTAFVASLDEAGEIHVLGRGFAGSSNVLLAGTELSLISLNQAVDQALGEANVDCRSMDCSVLALAGSTSPDVRKVVAAWTKTRRLTSHVVIIHDLYPVLVSGTDHAWGIALMVGTGSVAFGVDPAGATITRGGWGHWFGDKGSGFDIGSKALAAVAESSDDTGPETMLTDMVLEKLGTSDPRSMLKYLSSGVDTRREIAAMAPTVLDAADRQDRVARLIISDAVAESVKLVASVSKGLALSRPYPLALAGGVVSGSQYFRDELSGLLGRMQPAPEKISVVYEPVMGCLKIAQAKLLGP
jgi:N-acetylglucosamine kinase-like BadF-type ATPase